MGAYLSEPITKKDSFDERGKNVAYGASSMQGWRVSQEDAHNCCIEFDEDTSLFAVYDGHGGHEVATYCAKELPHFIKNTDAYKSGNIKQALIDAFMGFDLELAKPEVIKVLKEIASTSGKEDDARRDKIDIQGSNNKDIVEDDEESVSDLRMEASMPLEEVMARYSLCHKEGAASIDIETAVAAGPSCSSSSSSWSKSNELDVSSSSQPTSSKTDKDIEQPCAASNGESSNGLDDPDSSADAQKTCSSSGQDVVVSGSKPVSDIVTEPLENGDVKECDSVASSFQSSPGKGMSTRLSRKAARIAFDKRKKINEKNDLCSKDQVTASGDDEDDDDDDDEEDDDETFDGSPVASEEDVTDEVDDDDDDDDEQDSSDEDDNDNEDEEDDEDDAEFGIDSTEEPGSDSGCTAVVAILKRHELYVANAGDSRCVLCRDGQALELSLDHKPEDDPEMERIVKAGGKVTADGRVNGGLNLSRALGDHAYKQNATLPPEQQMISALPDVRHITIDPERDQFMILACDGIWNFMSSQEVVEFVRPRLDDQSSVSKICEELFDHCLASDTMGDGTGCDNMTAVIVKFNRPNECSLVSTKKRAASPSSNVVEASNGKVEEASDTKKDEGASKRSKTDIN